MPCLAYAPVHKLVWKTVWQKLSTKSFEYSVRVSRLPLSSEVNSLDGQRVSALCWLSWIIGCANTGLFLAIQFSSVAQSCPTLCDPMNCSTPGLPVHHQLPEFTQTHIHRVGDAIQPSYPLSSPSPPALNLSQHQGLLQWVNSSHQVAKILEFQL